MFNFPSQVFAGGDDFRAFRDEMLTDVNQVKNLP